MRTKRITGIPTLGNPLTGFYRILTRFGNYFHFIIFLFVLKIFHPLCNRPYKPAEMPVDCRISIVVNHIEYIARTVCDANTRNIPVGQCANRLSDNTTGLKIKSTMKMIGPYLSKISTQCQRKIEWRDKRCLSLLLLRKRRHAIN